MSLLAEDTVNRNSAAQSPATVSSPPGAPQEGPSGSPGSSGPVMEAAAPVLQDAADAVGGTADALLIDEGVARLNSDGDQVYMRVTGEAKVALEVGGKGQYGGDLSITQNGDGPDATYTVAVEKHALAAVTGTIPIPNLPLKGEIGVQTFDTVEMSFDTPEEAARAARLIQRLAVADAAGDVASTATPAGGGNPLANPLNESGAPNVALQEAVGITDADRDFLQSHVSAYEQTIAGRGRVAIEGKLPQLASVLELAGEARLDGRRILTRRVELPTDTQDGTLTYTLAEDVRLSAKEKATLGINVGNQLVVGPMVQNRVELGTSRIGVSASFDIPAGTDVTNSPVGGRPVPEVDIYAAGDLAPDRLTVEIDAEWRDQSLLTVSRGDSNRANLTATINDPTAIPDAVRQFIGGDPAAAAATADLTVTGEVQSIERTGLNVQAGGKLQIVEGAKAEATVIVEAGVDDVIGTRRITFDGQADPQDPAPVPAEPNPVDRLIVVPRNGLTLRDAPDGERQTVFQNGTFLEKTGDTVTATDGSQWVPVRGTDLNDEMVEGFVSAEFVQAHDPALGKMDATGRTNPTLERERYREVTVVDGDNLWDIASREGVDFEALVDLNNEHLLHPELIFAGDTVYIPGTAQGPEVPEPIEVPDPVSVDPASAASVTTESEGETRIDGQASVPGTASPVLPVVPVVPPVAPVSPPALGTDSGVPVARDLDGSPVGTVPTQPPMPAVDAAPEREAPGDLERILTEYQVPEEPDTTWRPGLTPEWTEDAASWAGDNLGWVPGVGPLLEQGGRRAENGFEITVRETEAALLDELGVFEQVEWAQMAEATANDAAAAYPKPPEVAMSPSDWANNGHTDAYRHALWNVRMTRSFGEDWTAAYATAHEQVAGNEAAREAMDLYNNEVGRRIAVENPNATDAEVEQLVADALRDGELLVLNSEGDLEWSNNVPYGSHGQPDRVFLTPDGEFLERNMQRDETDS